MKSLGFIAFRHYIPLLKLKRKRFNEDYPSRKTGFGVSTRT